MFEIVGCLNKRIEGSENSMCPLRKKNIILSSSLSLSLFYWFWFVQFLRGDVV